MNWDQLRPNHTTHTYLEVHKISQKFDQLRLNNKKHTNILVVIQGVDATDPVTFAGVTKEFRKCKQDFDLFYFDERKNVALGPSKLF